MKTVICVLMFSAGCANAGILDSFKSSANAVLGAVKQTEKDFIPFAGEVGKEFLHQVENSTINMIGNSLAAVIGDALTNLFSGKRGLADVLKQGTKLMVELKNLLHMGTSLYSALIDEVFIELQEISSHLRQHNILPQDAINKLENLLAKHTSFNKDFLTALEGDINLVVSNIFHMNKRNAATVTDLSTIVSSAFTPALDSITQLVSQVKDVLTNTANNLLNIAQGATTTVGEPLRPHN